MNNKTRIIGATAIIFSITACSSSTPVSKVINMRSDKVAIVSNSAETTSTLYQSAINKSYYCSSNAPDSTFSTSKDFDFSVSLLNFGGGSPEKEHSGSSSSGAEMKPQLWQKNAWQVITIRMGESVIGMWNGTYVRFPKRIASTHTRQRSAGACVCLNITF